MTNAVSVSRVAWTDAFPWKPSDLAMLMPQTLVEHDACTTPEAAVRSLQAAYRRRDLDAAVRCQDFRSEALLKLRRHGAAFDDEALDREAHALEVSFRRATVENWPDFEDVTSTVTSVEPMFGEFYIGVEAGSVGRSAYARTLYLSCIAGRWSVLGSMYRPCTYAEGSRQAGA
ncbi:hypothetical protein [Piscinibacter gummiphilus]|uniref:DUF4440 domain-containing protein n=1 Tax=Piscinibacter gummiphilus TaxID=946333 RepID=A0ABZ0CYT5_9BURK|nr:hypothetical protein [Piscinibacter gummiphilus]WOB10114.1 hypothetical protein RXV79_08615 [Piscinibacter gummiphilus]